MDMRIQEQSVCEQAVANILTSPSTARSARLGLDYMEVISLPDTLAWNAITKLELGFNIDVAAVITVLTQMPMLKHVEFSVHEVSRTYPGMLRNEGGFYVFRWVVLFVTFVASIAQSLARFSWFRCGLERPNYDSRGQTNAYRWVLLVCSAVFALAWAAIVGYSQGGLDSETKEAMKWTPGQQHGSYRIPLGKGYPLAVDCRGKPFTFFDAGYSACENMKAIANIYIGLLVVCMLKFFCAVGIFVSGNDELAAPRSKSEDLELTGNQGMAIMPTVLVQTPAHAA
ncbi:hypothetical protein GGI12_002303 [Dipsacomyces acuminosporus]|nr:hypothetical protein GGI12_002303 [Dipsacomyces acuminosporus]